MFTNEGMNIAIINRIQSIHLFVDISSLPKNEIASFGGDCRVKQAILHGIQNYASANFRCHVVAWQRGYPLATPSRN
jgi:hypothetical protein